MKNLKRAGVVLLAVFMLFSMAGCKKKTDEAKETTKTIKEEPVKEEEEVQEDIPANQNLLTKKNNKFQIYTKKTATLKIDMG